MLSPPMLSLTALTGTWSCERQSGTRTTPAALILTFQLWGDWLRSDVAEKGETTQEAFMKYDPKMKQWIEVQIGARGDYAVTTSNAAPSASKQTWTAAYPNDSLHRVVIKQYLGDKIVIDHTLEVDGKTEPIHDVCTRTV